MYPRTVMEWRRLLNTLTHDRDAARPHTASDSRKLPASYQAFLEVLGPGRLGGYFRVFAPGKEGGLDALARDVDPEVFGEVYGDVALAEALLPFSDTVGGDVFGWDTRTSDADGEHPVHAFPSGRTKSLKVADTFGEFVVEVCLGRRFAPFLGKGWRSRRSFESSAPRPRPSALADVAGRASGMASALKSLGSRFRQAVETKGASKKRSTRKKRAD